MFVDLRDRTGLTQVVFNAERNAAVHQSAHVLRSECVVSVTGQVMARPDESKNPNLPTGEIEERSGARLAFRSRWSNLDDGIVIGCRLELDEDVHVAVGTCGIGPAARA